jgi:histidinol-phosphate aminotransferase
LKDWQLDLEAALEMVSAKTSLIILANPNNPTGLQISRETLEEFLRAVPEHVLVVLDEAYAEYSSDQNLGLTLLKQHQNLLVLRTFSKAYGLAGLRIGYAIGQPSVIAALQGQRQQYHVNRIAQAAALAALTDQVHLRRGLQNNLICRQKFCAGLDLSGIGHLPSFANFVLVYCGRSSAAAEALQAYGLMVKPLERFGLPEFIRISIGLPEVIDHLLTALKTIQREQSWFPVWENAAIAPPQPSSGEKLWRF